MGSELIFVSYSSKDRPFALSFSQELERLGARIWIDQLGIKLGQNWDNAIEEALETADTFLLLISPTAADSQNVQDEVSIAKEKNKKLIPILIKPCDLPMRWKRLQYADLTTNVDKAIHDIVNELGLKVEAAESLKNVLSLLSASEIQSNETPKAIEINMVSEDSKEIELENLLASTEEIDRAITMHKKGIKKNKQLMAMVVIGSLVLLGILSFFDLDVPRWMIIIGCLSINLLAIRPFGSIKKRERNIDLMDLLKLKRDRLVRVLNKLTNKEIENFNQEFLDYITI